MIALRTGDVVIDLTESTFVDTAIVRDFADAQQLLDRQGRKLTFRSPSRLATRVLHLFGLADLIGPEKGRRGERQPPKTCKPTVTAWQQNSTANGPAAPRRRWRPRSTAPRPHKTVDQRRSILPVKARAARRPPRTLLGLTPTGVSRSRPAVTASSIAAVTEKGQVSSLALRRQR